LANLILLKTWLVGLKGVKFGKARFPRIFLVQNIFQRLVKKPWSSSFWENQKLVVNLAISKLETVKPQQVTQLGSLERFLGKVPVYFSRFFGLGKNFPKVGPQFQLG